MSKFYIDTPFDRWLIFEIEEKINSISFSEEKSGIKLSGQIRSELLNIFEKRSFKFFDYSSLNTSFLSEKAKLLHNFLIKTRIGETFTYSEVARELFGDERYRRATAMLLKHNRFAFLVPCHRVVAKNGIGGYSASVELKLKILKWEKKELP